MQGPWPRAAVLGLFRYCTSVGSFKLARLLAAISSRPLLRTEISRGSARLFYLIHIYSYAYTNYLYTNTPLGKISSQLTYRYQAITDVRGLFTRVARSTSGRVFACDSLSKWTPLMSRHIACYYRCLPRFHMSKKTAICASSRFRRPITACKFHCWSQICIIYCRWYRRRRGRSTRLPKSSSIAPFRRLAIPPR